MRKYLHQASEEWHAWRADGIGSSEVPCVLGKSPYMKPFELFEIKAGRRTPDFKENPAMRRGRELENIARLKFAAVYSLDNGVEEDFLPACYQDDIVPYMRSSLDGISRDEKHLIEIKYQGAENHRLAKECGTIRPHHMIQMQHQLLVSRAEFATFVSINDDAMITAVPVFQDVELQQIIIDKCSEFWRQVMLKRWSTEGTAKLPRTSPDPTAHLFEQYEAMGAEIAELEEQRELIKQKIVASGVKECGPWRVTEVERAGTVDWKKIQEKYSQAFISLGLVPDDYRKLSTKYPQIRRIN